LELDFVVFFVEVLLVVHTVIHVVVRLMVAVVHVPASILHVPPDVLHVFCDELQALPQVLGGLLDNEEQNLAKHEALV
jgi:hypothetical protein